MKIAVISDIHGNYYALKEILQRANAEGVEELLCLGDFVGYYYHPEKVLQLLAEWKCEAIRGNHEELLFSLINKQVNAEEIKSKYGSGHQIALEKLTENQLNFLAALPESKIIKRGETKIMMCHGSPWDKNYYVYPDASSEILEKFSQYGVDFVLFGHSHYAFARRNKDCMIINVGSVGQSRNQSGLAHWTIINTETQAFEMRATPYDVGRLINEIRTIDPQNSYLIDVLVRN